LRKIKKISLRYGKIPPKEWYLWRDVVNPDNWISKGALKKSPKSSNLIFADMFIKNLKNLQAICKINNIKYIPILQPTLIPEFKARFSEMEAFLACISRGFKKSSWGRNFFEKKFLPQTPSPKNLNYKRSNS